MPNFLNLSKYDSSILNGLSSHVQTRQGEMFAFGKMAEKYEALKNVVKSKIVYAYQGKQDAIDQRTGIKVKARSLYAGTNPDTDIPDWEHPVANIDKLAKAKAVIAQGETASTTEIDKALHNPYYPEFEEIAKAYNQALLSTESAAAVHTSQDFPVLQNVNVTGEVIIEQQTEFPLLDLVAVENTTSLVFRRYNGEGFDIEALVAEGGETSPKKMKFSKQEWYTRKSGGEIQWTDEHELQEYFINPLQLAQGQFSIAAAKVKQDKLFKVLGTLQTQAGGNVTAWEDDHQEINPLNYFALVRKFINFTNYGKMDIGAMSSKTLFAILSNNNIKGITGTQGLTGESGSRATIPGLPGVSFIIYDGLDDGKVYLLDSQKAIKRIQGIVRTEQYRLPRIGGNGLVYRDWNDVQKRDNNKAKVITGLLG